jgi:lipopolysaccharide/colanic/teichoic acid biosynthesis glycosyltransferase
LYQNPILNNFVHGLEPPRFTRTQRTQRVFDFISAGVGIVVLSPLFVILAATIKVHDGGPVFYRATRVGKAGHLFRLFKFRSMVPDADRQGAGITVYRDARVTPVGRVLRRFKLDELPQLINVVKGEMSLVGPRPEDPRYVALYDSVQRNVLTVRPGITSTASLQFKDEESVLTGKEWETLYVQEIMPKKLAMELEYIPQRTVLKDVKIVLRTLGGILK